MGGGEEDEGLDLLLGLLEAEQVPDSPPPSPARASPPPPPADASPPLPAAATTSANQQQQAAAAPATLSYRSDDEDDDESARARRPRVSMAAFKPAVAHTTLPQVTKQHVQQHLHHHHHQQQGQGRGAAAAAGIETDKYSGVRIKDRLVSHLELSSKLADLRFVALASLRAAMAREPLRGAWATAAVVAEKLHPKVTSAGAAYAVWKLSCLDGAPAVALFVFGDAYARHWTLSPGSLVALFNASARPDKDGAGPGRAGPGVSLSVARAAQVMKLGTAADYGVCRAPRRDGAGACGAVLDRRHGDRCGMHAAEAARRLRTGRVELRGGKVTRPAVLKAAAWSEPQQQQEEQDGKKTAAPAARYLSTADLKKWLSRADKVSATGMAQGKRLVAVVSERPDDDGARRRGSKAAKKENGHPHRPQQQQRQPSGGRAPLADRNVNVTSVGSSGVPVAAGGARAAKRAAAATPAEVVMELELDGEDRVSSTLHPWRFLSATASAAGAGATACRQ